MQNHTGSLVYTYGAFDLLHVGHIRLLERAKALGDCLIVGILSDRAIKERKGLRRPIQSQNNRMFIIEALKCVDSVCSQENYDPSDNLSMLKADILTKGDDWEHCGRIANLLGIKFIRLNYSPEFSTSKIVREIQSDPVIK